MSQLEFGMSARFDSAVCEVSGGLRHLIVELEPPSLSSQEARKPLDLVLVLDASGSMGGGKLDAVKGATLQILQRLRADDRVSIVSFADDVQVHANGVALQSSQGQGLLQEVLRMHTRGSTNLSGGWLMGVELASARLHSERRAAVVLLSDGQANQGIVEPNALRKLALECAARGVATTCVGVGEDYSTQQLGVIADVSGGRFHHADTLEAICKVLLGELDELAAIAAEQVEIGVELPHGFGLQPLGALSSRKVGQMHRIVLGSLYGGTKRVLVVALDVPPHGDGFEVEVPVAVIGSAVASGEPFSLGARCSLRWGDPRATPPSEGDVVLVVQQTGAWLERLVADLNEQGDFAQVAMLRALHLPRLRQYAGNNAEALREVRRLEQTLHEAQSAMPAMTRKELFVRSYKSSRSERDLR